MDDEKTMKMPQAKAVYREPSTLEDEPFANTGRPGADQPTPRPGQAPARPNLPTVGAEAATIQPGAPAPDAAPFARMPAPGADQPTPRPGQMPAYNPPPAFVPASPAPAWNPPAPSPAAGRGGDAATMMIGAQSATVAFAWLVVMDGPDRGRFYPLRSETTTLGRAQANDVVIADNAVSSQHLKIRIEPQENGDLQYLLIDMASRNGTYVGSKATYREDASRVYRRILHDGDFLLLGETTLVFKCV